MKPRFAARLVCPEDRGPLQLIAWDTHAASRSSSEQELLDRAGVPHEHEEVVTGVLHNPRLRRAYPIVHGVPRMLLFATGVSRQFLSEHGARLGRELPGVSLPNGQAMPGEEDVLRTFSSEWLNYDWDGESYWNQSADAWFRSMDYVLELEPGQHRGQTLLEVGIGIGGVADHVSRSQAAEVVGMDLGYSVDAAYRHFGANPLLHIVQASAFHPPFAHEAFDFVYSFGVIHHTFSTRRAFDSIARLPKVGGRLYVWVYSPENERRNPLRRALMAIETVVRPVVTALPEKAQAAALLPTVPVYMAHQWVQKLRGQGDALYGFREAMHAARDRLTPKFAHRHSEDELAGWFVGARYSELHRASAMAPQPWVPVGFLSNAAVSGTRRDAGAA